MINTFTDTLPEEWLKLPIESNPHKRVEEVLERSPRVLDYIQNRIDNATAAFNIIDSVLEIENKDEKNTVIKAIKNQNKTWRKQRDEVARWERGYKLWSNEFIVARKKYNTFN